MSDIPPHRLALADQGIAELDTHVDRYIAAVRADIAAIGYVRAVARFSAWLNRSGASHTTVICLAAVAIARLAKSGTR